MTVKGFVESGKASANFWWKELQCHDPKNPEIYPKKWRQTRLKRVLGVAEGFRAWNDGRPLTVGSCFRTPSWNRKKKGKPASQHPKGRGIDLHKSRHQTLKEFHKRALEYSQMDMRIGGIGLYNWGVHFDVRFRAKNAKPAHWNMVSRKVKLHDSPPLHVA